MSRKTIAFHDNSLSVRGTTVAIYDYAHYNETILNNSSIIVISSHGWSTSDPIATRKVCRRFPICIYKDLNELEEILQEEDVSLFYTIKYGKRDGVFSRKIKTAVHCVYDMTEPHGDVYAAVSLGLARKFNSTLYVPHIISLKPDKSKNLRHKLNIPDNALVIGRYGGLDTFDLDFCWNTIHSTVQNNDNIYFVFINTEHRITHPHIHYLDKIVSENDKNEFLATLDVYVECSSLGHTFGIALGEASVHNLILLVYNGPLWNRAHIDMLGNSALFFANETKLIDLINTLYLNKKNSKNICQYTNEYTNCTPEKVMPQFEKVFLNSK
jgi:hypothetical protein